MSQSKDARIEGEFLCSYDTAIAPNARARTISLGRIAMPSYFKGYEPCQECCGIKLPDNGLQVVKASCPRMYRNDIAVTRGSQRGKA